MKIRIKGNSIRYRLTKSEVDAFCRTGHYAETTEFGEGTFSYALKISKGITHLDVEFQNNTITLFVPETLANDWNINEEVGFEHQLTLPNGKLMRLLVEKDFVCMDETVEDQTNNYPNPKAI